MSKPTPGLQSLPAGQTPPIHLHPFSYPDELHASQVSRYHFHSGNRDQVSTFFELYGTRPFRISGAIPRNIQIFASKLSGDTDSRFIDLLRQNTLAPLLEVFNGASVHKFIAGQTRDNDSRLLFRRVVGELGNIRLCLQCIRDDTVNFGEGYIHRSHQIPGTNCCFEHGQSLITKCQICHNPFESTNHLDLVWAPWQRCRCGTYLSEQEPAHKAREHSEAEVALARFGMGVLNLATRPIDPAVLVETYRRRLIEMGLNNKSVIDRIGLHQALVDHYGEQVLANTDYALRAEKKQMWLRLTARSGAADTPMPRHLLVANLLFGNCDQFMAALQAQENLHEAEPRNTKFQIAANQPHVTSNACFSKEQKLKQDICKELELHPKWGLDDLWLHRRRLMTRLFKGPNKDQSVKWLLKVTTTKRSNIDSPPKTPQQDDKEWAQKIEDSANAHYRSVDRPVKQTKNRLLRSVNWRKPRNPDPEEYPLTVAKLDTLAESRWHYNARKILWSRIVNGTPDMAPYRICELVSTEYHRGIDLVARFAQMPYSVSMGPGVVMKWLNYFKIPLAWTGPKEQEHYYEAGRKYVRRQPGKHITPSDHVVEARAKGGMNAP